MTEEEAKQLRAENADLKRDLQRIVEPGVIDHVMRLHVIDDEEIACTQLRGSFAHAKIDASIVPWRRAM